MRSSAVWNRRARSFSRHLRTTAAELLGDLAVDRPRVWGRLAFLFDGDGKRRLAFERRASGQHLEKDDAEGVDIRARIGLFPVHLLGRHVLGRSDHHPCTRDPLRSDRAGDAEVHDPGPALAVDHDILRLEVPVNDSETMGLGQAFGGLARDGQRLADGQGPDAVEEALKVLPGNIFHGDEIGPRFLLATEVVHTADVAVGDGPSETELAPEALDRVGVRGNLGLKELQGKLFPDLGIEDLVDAAHAAPPQLLDDLIAAGEGRARGQLADGGDQGFRHRRGGSFDGERRGATAAEPGVGRADEAATGTLQSGLPYVQVPG